MYLAKGLDNDLHS